jgi:hypothetical protein
MRLCVRSGQELGPKEVAHSCYRVDRLRGRSQRLHRAHLRSVMLAKPFGVTPLLLQHPVQVGAELPGCRDGRLGLPFARSNFV